jgi:hypothetical protein
METERDGHLPFLDTKIYRRPNGSLGHKVYRKPTHTNFYLNSSSHHHPSNRYAILSTLVHWARDLCDQDSLYVGLVFLEEIFRQNGYNDWQMGRALKPRPRVITADKKTDSVTFLPYVRSIFNHISRVLSQHNIKYVRLPPGKKSSFLRLVKDDLGLKMLEYPVSLVNAVRLHWTDGPFD